MRPPPEGKENCLNEAEAGGAAPLQACNRKAGLLFQQHEQAAQGGCLPAARAPLQLTVDVSCRGTPQAPLAWAPPVSCPSRLQHGSPARSGSAASFDPFAAPPDELPGCTPLCGPAPAAPPAVNRKASGSTPPDDGAGGSADNDAGTSARPDEGASCGSPVAPPRPSALFANRVQSCPPERMGRHGNRPLVRLRVKRSLNGAVAAAGAAPGARRSMDAGLPGQQLAGCSRKRLDADLLSPPMPRKASRTLLDDEQAADMMARLHLAGTAPAGCCGGAAAAAATAAPQVLAGGIWPPAAAAEAAAPGGPSLPPTYS